MTRSNYEAARDAVVTAAMEYHRTRLGLAVLFDRCEALHQMELNPIRATHGAYSADAQPTSRKAAFQAKLLQGSVRKRIVTEIYCLTAVSAELVGLTDDDLERRLKVPHHTLSSARNHLVMHGWLKDSGLTRKTRGGREAIVWRLTEAAEFALTNEAQEAT